MIGYVVNDLTGSDRLGSYYFLELISPWVDGSQEQPSSPLLEAWVGHFFISQPVLLGLASSHLGIAMG